MKSILENLAKLENLANLDNLIYMIMVYSLMNFKSAAVKVLVSANQPLHYKEITKRAIDLGLIKNTGKTPDQTMSGTITADIKKHGTVRFITIGKGVFKLNPDCYDGIDQSELKMSYNI